MQTEVLPRANRAMVTNNSTVLTEVSANRNRANRGVAVYLLFSNVSYLEWKDLKDSIMAAGTEICGLTSGKRGKERLGGGVRGCSRS